MSVFCLEPLESRTLFAAFTPGMVKDISSGSSSTSIREITAVGNQVFFLDWMEDDLWKSDGTSAGTVKVKEGETFGSMYGLGNLHAVGNKLFFTAYDGDRDGMYLWVSDGTTGGTKAIKYLSDALYPGYEVRGTDLNGTFVFAAQNANDAWVLWRSNGTAAGTRVVKVITTDTMATDPQNFIRAGNRVFFTADNGVHGDEMWTSNGTAVGTYMLKDIIAGDRGSMPFLDGDADYAVVGGLLYFVAQNASLYDWLWVTNGTRVGTRAKMQLGLNSSHLTAVGNQLYYFQSFDLYRTLGTPATKVKVADTGESNSWDENLPVLNGKLFFSSLGGSTESFEPWVSGGTAATTFRIANINPGGASFPSDFHRVGNYVMFVANNGTHGEEIYVTQGTAASTRRLREVRVGTSTPWIDEITVVGNRVFFAADNGVHGEELWSFTVPATASAAVARPTEPTAIPQDAAAVAVAVLRDRTQTVTRDRDDEAGEEAADSFDLLEAVPPMLSWRE